MLDGLLCCEYVHRMSKVLPIDHMGIYPTVEQVTDGHDCRRAYPVE
jgi:hypothetical protein